MIGGDDQGARRRDVLGADDLDVRVEELQEPAEQAAHEAFVATLGEAAIWKKYA